MAIPRNCRSATYLAGVPGGSDRIHLWMLGSSSSNRRICVTRTVDVRSRTASAARFFTCPASRSACQASAFASSFTIKGGSVGTGLGFDRRRASTWNRPEKFALVSGLGRHREEPALLTAWQRVMRAHVGAV